MRTWHRSPRGGLIENGTCVIAILTSIELCGCDQSSGIVGGAVATQDPTVVIVARSKQIEELSLCQLNIWGLILQAAQ